MRAQSPKVYSFSPNTPERRRAFWWGRRRNSSPQPSSSIRLRVEAWIVSPRKSRRKSACFSSTVTVRPSRSRRTASIIPAGPPPTTQTSVRSMAFLSPAGALDHLAGHPDVDGVDHLPIEHGHAVGGRFEYPPGGGHLGVGR